MPRAIAGKGQAGQHEGGLKIQVPVERKQKLPPFPLLLKAACFPCRLFPSNIPAALRFLLPDTDG
jgi:hypothetical protein